jgi:hypothetical protein
MEAVRVYATSTIWPTSTSCHDTEAGSTVTQNYYESLKFSIQNVFKENYVEKATCEAKM